MFWASLSEDMSGRPASVSQFGRMLAYPIGQEIHRNFFLGPSVDGSHSYFLAAEIKFRSRYLITLVYYWMPVTGSGVLKSDLSLTDRNLICRFI